MDVSLFRNKSASCCGSFVIRDKNEHRQILREIRVVDGEEVNGTISQPDATRTRTSSTGWRRQNAVPREFDSKPSDAAFSPVFQNFD